MGLKRCKQCGMLKDETAFRQYSYAKAKGTTGRYRICRDCESINTTMRRSMDRLETIGPLTVDTPCETIEEARRLKATVEKISSLYTQLKARGLQIPTIRIREERPKAEDMVDHLLEFYGQSPLEQALETTVEKTPETQTAIPDDLASWLDGDPQEWAEKGLSPEYLQEVVYESLKAKYRPQLGVDPSKMVPIYDDTYKRELNAILRRFDDYEEACAEEDSDG